MQGKGEYEIGKGKPPKRTQFKPGQSGNPGGKTTQQRAMEIENAERATRIRKRLLEALEGVMLEHPEKEKIVGDQLRADVLRLLKEAEDRGLGTPKNTIDLSSEDGTMTPPTVIRLVGKDD